MLLSLIAGQEVALSLPPGSSPEFQVTAHKAQTLIEQGRFEEADRLLDKCFSFNITVEWDDSRLPSEFKESYVAARNEAFADWTEAIPELKVKVAKTGRIKVSFTDSLPPSADSVKPAGAVFFVSDGASEPRIEAVIAQKRDTPPGLIDPRHVQNEVGYAIGASLGLAKFPRPIGYMGRMDTLNKLLFHVHPREVDTVRAIETFVGQLKKAVASKTRLKVAKPEMFVDVQELKADEAHQGERLKFSIQVSNRGNSDLQLKAYTDCSCISLLAPAKVAPGQTALVDVGVDTQNLMGEFKRSFVIYSNDPEQADRTIWIKTWVTPEFRLLEKTGTGTVVFDDETAKKEFYFVYDPTRPVKVSGVKLNGLNAATEFEPWEGNMSDPQLNQPEIPRKGYKITVLASPTKRSGRVPITFLITTDRKERPTVIETIHAQWGIVAMPQELNFGQVSRHSAVASFIVSRPGKPFKILSGASDTDNVTVTVEPFRDNTYRVSVVILASAPLGPMQANISLETDDPKQKSVLVPLRAILR